MSIWEGWDPGSDQQEHSQWRREEGEGTGNEGLGEREAPFCPFHYEGGRKEEEGPAGMSRGSGTCSCPRLLGYVNEEGPTSDLISVC